MRLQRQVPDLRPPDVTLAKTEGRLFNRSFVDELHAGCLQNKIPGVCFGRCFSPSLLQSELFLALSLLVGPTPGGMLPVLRLVPSPGVTPIVRSALGGGGGGLGVTLTCSWHHRYMADTHRAGAVEHK